ncbi:unnamed protein product [Rotaria sordida]|uniref:BED-type domain-containing protein n=1 Tax=Rotaria sordida TaxID=392033 RepID=A0A815D812_9BILA|nr:unnamed protein product [Rotaria sordida]CAF1280993.1 unnamed protein product [Rotaria sordida]CAF1294904.1 unnamed protein product [Rotaria sordida]CAF3775891.1 unnamed protein product [Rotaria sordida]CAF3794899.1 unnamed protein product [Rotaria sordida]
MKTRRRTIDSISLLSDNENQDKRPSTSSIEPLTVPAPDQTPTATTTTTPPTTVPDESIMTTLKSNVWEYFERCTNVHPLKAKCSICNEDLLTPNYGTSSLKRHLIQRHSLKQFTAKETSNRFTSSIILSRTEKRRLDSIAINAIIKDSRAFGDFQKSGLKKLIDALKPGYKGPHRNIVVQQLKRLNQQHTIKTKVQFEEANFLSITCDFWKNRQQKSFLVITGHYIDINFNEHSKILKFITFDDRHFSMLIAQEIEKQLISLRLYDKLFTVTCDGASNMRHMFTYFNRRNIKYINCIAHKFHLVICNSLNLWISVTKKQTAAARETITEDNTDQENDDDDDSQTTLNHMIKSMSVDLNNISNQSDLEENETNDMLPQDGAIGESRSDTETTDLTSDEEDSFDEHDDDEIFDNFIEGVNTEEIQLDDIQRKVREVIDITRDIVKTANKTSILSSFIDKKRSDMNTYLSKHNQIKRRLSIDVRTRWNSTFKMLSTINIYRDIINDMFKSKGSLGLTANQRKKLTQLELSTGQWDLINPSPE